MMCELQTKLYKSARRRRSMKQIFSNIFYIKNILVSLIVAIGFVAISYMVFPQIYGSYEPTSIIIIQMAEPGAKNPDGFGAVLIFSITVNGVSLDLGDIELGDGWWHRWEFDEALIADGMNPSAFEVPLQLSGDIEIAIEFYRGIEVGIVRIESPIGVYEHDLFTYELDAELLNHRMIVTNPKDYNIGVFTLSFLTGAITTFFLCLLIKWLSYKYQLLWIYSSVAQKLKLIDSRLYSLATDIPENVESKTNRHLIKLLSYLAASLIPNIFLFDLYNRNHLTNHILFFHTLFVAFILAIVGIGLFLILSKLERSLNSALICALFLWIMFWLYGAMNRMVWISVCIGLLTVFTIVFRRYGLIFGKIQSAFNLLAICLCVFFLLNFIPAARHEIIFRDARARRIFETESEVGFYIKHEFLINRSLLSPDIYWFHMDGLMNLNTFERFWGIPQNHIREALSERGFLLYEDGFIKGGNTRWGLAALLSPALYSRYLQFIFYDTKNTMMQQDGPLGLHGIYAEHAIRASRDGINIFTDIAPYPELLTALLMAGYELYNPPVLDIGRLHGVMYNYNVLARLLRSDLVVLLNLATPLNLPTDMRREYFVSADSIVSNEESPRFTWITSMKAHIGNIWVFAGLESYESGHYRHDLYPLVFEIAVNAMIAEIDVILERNPSAVIVLQADHGFHYTTMHHQLLNDGYSIEQVLEMAFSVFSAVRIPLQYGELDMPLSPLNISRELVNRFVGENYLLLP